MKFLRSLAFASQARRPALVLIGLLLLTAGCATMSGPRIGITGADEGKPLTGPRAQ